MNKVGIILPDKKIGSTFPHFYNPFSGLNELELLGLKGIGAYKKMAEMAGIPFQEFKKEIEAMEKMDFDEYIQQEEENEKVIGKKYKVALPLGRFVPEYCLSFVQLEYLLSLMKRALDLFQILNISIFNRTPMYSGILGLKWRH